MLFISILIVWGIAAQHTNPLFVPSPRSVLRNLILMLQNGQLFKAIEYSFLRITVATILSGAISFPIALLIYNSNLAFVYMMPSVVLCLEEVSQDLIETGLTMGMNKLQTIFRIQIPASLPSVLNSFIMMYGIGFTYIAVTETINAKYGLGYIIQQSSSRGRTDLVFMAIIVIMVISVLFDFSAKKLVKHVFKWRYVND